jgi:hypothetical protein
MRNKADTWKDFTNIVGKGGTFATEELLHMSKELRYSSNIFDAALSLFDRTAAPARSLYGASEYVFKYGKYLHNLEKGMAKKDAAWDAMDWTFNYGEITRATAFIRSYLDPFVTWKVKSLPMIAKSILDNPVQWTGLIGLYKGLQYLSFKNLNISSEEQEYIDRIMPEYIKDGLFFVLPWRDKDNRLQLLNLTYLIPGFGDIFEMASQPLYGLLSHPLATIAAGWLNNTKYSGAPICLDAEPWETRLAKKLLYVWENLVPGPVPGGTDWNMVWKTIAERGVPAISEKFHEPHTKKSLTAAQATSSMFGLKIVPVDLNEWRRIKKAVIEKNKNQLKSSTRKELKQVTSPKEKSRIREKYQSRMERYRKKALGY